MNCKRCNTSIENTFKYCPNCGNQIVYLNIFSTFKIILVILLIFLETFSILLTRNVFAVVAWLLSLIFLCSIIIINKIFNYFIITKSPNFGLLIKLFHLNILTENDLFTIDYFRFKRGLESIFNNSEGLIIKCVNHCNDKNQIQQNFINKMNTKK